jgi:hypothetical protein
LLKVNFLNLKKAFLEQSSRNQNANRRRTRRRQQARRKNTEVSFEADEEEDHEASVDYDQDEESSLLDTNSLTSSPPQLLLLLQEISLLEVTTTLHIMQGDYNANRKGASPVLSPDDACSICLCQWDQFTDIAIVAVLKCSHVLCASCLHEMHKECMKTQNDHMGTYKLPFCCSLCRSTIKPSILDDLATAVVNKGLVLSFVQFIDQSASYEESKEERKKMVVSLLANTCEFDVIKVEIHLFNLLQMILYDSSRDLNSNEKSEYFDLARAPVRKLEAEYKQLKSELDEMCDKEGADWRSLNSKIQRVNRKIAEARSNATKVAKKGLILKILFQKLKF